MIATLWLLAIQGIIGVFLSGARDIYEAPVLTHRGWLWGADKVGGRS
jgi:hypothetical protein